VPPVNSGLNEEGSSLQHVEFLLLLRNGFAHYCGDGDGRVYKIGRLN